MKVDVFAVFIVLSGRRWEGLAEHAGRTANIGHFWWKSFLKVRDEDRRVISSGVCMLIVVAWLTL
jgi:hypothetical protein